MRKSLKDKIRFSQLLWWCLKHKDGWMVGTERGVICYEDHELAMAANTLHYGRSGGTTRFRIVPFMGAEYINGEYTPKLSLSEGTKWLKQRGRI